MATAATTPERSPTGDTLAMRHLRLWLRPLGRVLAAAVERQQASAQHVGPADVRAGCITDRHAEELLAQAAREAASGFPDLPPLRLNTSEETAEHALLDLARGRETQLPLAQLRAGGLDEVEVAMLLIVAAMEISVAYSRLYGYLVDDLTRCSASVELVLRLTRGDAEPEWRRRRMLDRCARLRHSGLLVAEPDRNGTELRSRLQLGAGVFAWLTGACATMPCRLDDPDLITLHAADFELGDRPGAAAAIDMLRRGGAVGVWGASVDGVADVALGIAAATKRAVYRCSCSSERRMELLDAALAAATHHEAALWIRCDRHASSGGFRPDPAERPRAMATEMSARTRLLCRPARGRHSEQIASGRHRRGSYCRR
jgi:hypothetical protein